MHTWVSDRQCNLFLIPSAFFTWCRCISAYIIIYIGIFTYPSAVPGRWIGHGCHGYVSYVRLSGGEGYHGCGICSFARPVQFPRDHFRWAENPVPAVEQTMQSCQWVPLFHWCRRWISWCQAGWRFQEEEEGYAWVTVFKVIWLNMGTHKYTNTKMHINTGMFMHVY